MGMVRDRMLYLYHQQPPHYAVFVNQDQMAFLVSAKAYMWYTRPVFYILVSFDILTRNLKIILDQSSKIIKVQVP